MFSKCFLGRRKHELKKKVLLKVLVTQLQEALENLLGWAVWETQEGSPLVQVDQG